MNAASPRVIETACITVTVSFGGQAAAQPRRLPVWRPAALPLSAVLSAGFDLAVSGRLA